MHRSIQEVARMTGVTSRTLRHYDAIGLLRPSGSGPGGARYYDDDALVRLQRILLLRELGLALPQIAGVLAAQVSEQAALEAHVAWLREERERLARRIASVERTIEMRRGGEPLMTPEMFDGFDHTEHRDEVVERWGPDAYESGDAWWRGMTDADRAAWQAQTAALARDWIDAAERGEVPGGPVAQALAERHVAWLAGVPGTPASQTGGDVAAYVTGLGDMYVADPRFAAVYATSEGGATGAGFVRDALRTYARTRL